jgi:hypothetical protein
MDYITSGTTNFYPLIFSPTIDGSLSSEPQIQGQHFSGQTRFSVNGGSAQLVTRDSSFPDSEIAVVAWSRNQEDRFARLTRDGVSVTAVGPYNTSGVDGNFIGLQGQPYSVLGALAGDYSDTTDVSTTKGSLRIFEQHFWKGDVLQYNLAELKEFIDTLKQYYAAV